MPSQPNVAPNTNWLKTIASPPQATLDIVAVHGMNLGNNQGHADNTWTDAKSGTNWLSDLLSERIPSARILAYQYNANIAFGTSASGVEEQAKNMLYCLWSERKSDSSRPIIFIAHSMGGIIVKEALAIAHNGDGAYSMISTITYGVFFFAVPHRGSQHASWGRTATNIITMCGVQLNKSFLNSLESGSAYNDMLNAKFESLLESYRYFSVCETLPEVKNGIDCGIIVPKHSAILGLSDLQEIKIFPNRSHSTVCKFASAVEPEWKQISETICYAATQAVRAFSYSPTVLKRKEMLQCTSWHLEETGEEAVPLQNAIERAQEVLGNLDDAAECSIQISEMRGEIGHLNIHTLTLATWFWSVLEPVMSVLAVIPAFFISALLLPSKPTVMEKAEQVQRSELEAMELEILTMETLDTRRYSALQSIGMLRNAVGSDSLQDEDHGTRTCLRFLARQLQLQLNKHAERIVLELHTHRKSYIKRQATLRLIDEGKRVAEQKSEEEFWLWVGRKVKKEKENAEKTRFKEDDQPNDEDTRCPWGCVVL